MKETENKPVGATGLALYHCTPESGIRPSQFDEDSYIHFLCEKGSVRFVLNGRRFMAEADPLVIWQMGRDVSEVEYSPDFEATAVVASREFRRQFKPDMPWDVRRFIYLKLHPAFRLDAEGLALCREDLRLLERRLVYTGIFSREIHGRAMQIFLFDLWRIYYRELDAMAINDTAAAAFFRFLELVQQHCRVEHEVAFYAGLLCITPNYLSELCRKMTGYPASGWINYYAIAEVKKLFADPSLSLADISAKMHFSNLSHFTRFVKRLTGLTPSEYRKRSQL